MAGFKDGARPAGFAALICGDKSGDAPAENDDTSAAAVDEVERARSGLGEGQEAERLHEDECCAVSTGLAGSHQEVTPGKAHLVGLS